jgi:hypothetical protein
LSHRRRLVQLAFALLAGLGPVSLGPSLLAAAPKTAPDPEVVLRRARAAYVGLAEKGFQRYHFFATPDWSALLAEQAKENPAGYDAAMKIFSKVRFEVLVGAQGDAQVSHNIVDTPNQQSTAGLNQVYGGMEQILTGFFQTWTPFMLQTPFPPVGHAVKVEDAGTHYRVNWDEEGNTKVELLMDKTFIITDMKVQSPAFDSTIRPTFDRKPDGLVLTGYDAEYQVKANASSMRLKVLIKNQSLQGLPLPAALDLSVWNGGNKQQITMAFSEMTLEKK